jgi:hypothetical protein
MALQGEGAGPSPWIGRLTIGVAQTPTPTSGFRHIPLWPLRQLSGAARAVRVVRAPPAFLSKVHGSESQFSRSKSTSTALRVMSWLSKAFKMVQKINFIALYYSSGHKNTSDAACMGKKKIVKYNHERVITIEEYRKVREKVLSD